MEAISQQFNFAQSSNLVAESFGLGSVWDQRRSHDYWGTTGYTQKTGCHHQGTESCFIAAYSSCAVDVFLPLFIMELSHVFRLHFLNYHLARPPPFFSFMFALLFGRGSVGQATWGVFCRGLIGLCCIHPLTSSFTYQLPGLGPEVLRSSQCEPVETYRESLSDYSTFNFLTLCCSVFKDFDDTCISAKGHK